METKSGHLGVTSGTVAVPRKLSGFNILNTNCYKGVKCVKYDWISISKEGGGRCQVLCNKLYWTHRFQNARKQELVVLHVGPQVDFNYYLEELRRIAVFLNYGNFLLHLFGKMTVQMTSYYENTYSVYIFTKHE